MSKNRQQEKHNQQDQQKKQRKRNSFHELAKVPLRKWKSLGRREKRLVVILLAVILLISAAGYTVFIDPLTKQDKWVYKETLVERGPLTVGVTESGSLEYGITTIEYNLDLDVGSDEDEEDDDEDDDEETIQKYLKVEAVFTAAGQRITEGDSLLKFTEDSVSDVRKLLEKALVDAQSAYQEEEAKYDLAVLEAKTDYQSQEAAAKYASSIYQSAVQSIDNDIAAMEVEIEQRTTNISSLEEKKEKAQEDYEDALETYQAARDIMEQTGTDHASNFLTIQNQYLSARTKYESARSALEQASQNLEVNQEKIESLRTQITQAQAKRTINKLDTEENYQESLINGDNARITYQAKLESLKEDLNEALKDKTEIEKQLADFEAFVGKDGILYADGSGIVTQVGYEAGDILKETGTAVSYAHPEDMTISVDVTQEDVTALAVGDKVEIIFSAYEDNPYEGSILSIDTTATSRESATISYTVVIGVKGDTQQLYGGMTADVTFVTEEKEDVLYLSKKAVVEKNGKTYVYMDTALGKKELKEVTTGISNGVYIEIISGLEEGDTVYIASKVSSQEEVENFSEDQKSTDGTDQNGTMDVMPPDSIQNGSFDIMPDSSTMDGMPAEVTESGFDTSGQSGPGGSGWTGGGTGMEARP